MPSETRPSLTERQQDILDYIREHIKDWQFPPSVRDIADAFGIKSPNGVMFHLNALEKKGYIHRHRLIARSIAIIE